MLDPFLSHELAVGRDHRGQRVVLVRVERDIFHRRRLLSRLNTAECLPRTRYPRRARRRSAYIPSTASGYSEVRGRRSRGAGLEPATAWLRRVCPATRTELPSFRSTPRNFCEGLSLAPSAGAYRGPGIG